MSSVEIIKKIKNGVIHSSYFLYGTENYFIEQIKNELTYALADKIGEEVVTYDLRETPIQDIINDAETLPFFSEKKLIFINEPIFLKTKTDKLAIKHDLATLEKYVKNPAAHSVIVIIAPYEKIDERKKITKLLKTNTTVVKCEPIKEHDINKWITRLATEYKITVTDEALAMIEAELTTDLYLLQSEMMKLAAYVGENGIVTEEVTEKLLSPHATGSALRLVDAVIERDLNKAVMIYKDLEKMKEEPIALIALLAFQFRLIFQVKLLKQKGYTQHQVQKQLKAHPYVIKLAFRREKQFTENWLAVIMNQLAETDAAIKQGKMEKGIAFELLLYELVKQ